jgi:site-specific DNA-methyltransferase (adenine-specific)/adenine-specific DNA-methyltransferase
VELVERCVLALTNEGDFVYDPYAGVGTTLIAGIKHKRKVIGSEKEKEYIEITKNRISSYFNGELKLRPLGKPIFDPSKKVVKSNTLGRYANNE